MKTTVISSELSWLYFNQCIIDEAADVTNPLYERIKFLAIFSSNLDEFFRVKVNHLASDKSTRKSKLFSAILHEINIQQEQFGEIWRTQIIPELEQNSIIFYQEQPIDTCHLKEIGRYFKSEVLSFIQIVFIKNGTDTIYFLDNRRLYFLVKLKNTENQFEYAYINIPSDKLDRFKLLSKKDHTNYIISLDEIIKSCSHFIFANYTIESCFAIKMNRDEDYEIEDEDSGDLINKIKHKIKERKTGLPTRFLYDTTMPVEDIALCKNTFQLKKREMIAGGTYHNLFDLFKFPNPLKPKLQGPNYPALEHPAFENSNSVFDVIDSKNQLLYFPYHSYHYVLQFLTKLQLIAE